MGEKRRLAIFRNCSHLVTTHDQLHGVTDEEEDYDEDERESGSRVPLFTESQSLPGKCLESPLRCFSEIGTVTVRHGATECCVPVLPNQLQFPPDEGVESAEGGDGDEQRDEEGADHVVAQEVTQGVGWRDLADSLLPADQKDFIW